MTEQEGLPGSPRIRCLTLHAAYACGQTGLCCATPWDVPVEAESFAAIGAAAADGRLPVVQPFEAGPWPPPAGAAAVLRRDAAGCVLLDGATRRCRVHAVLGAAAQPRTCRQFPRIARIDPGGVAVTLSHYCPTAARLLLREDVPLAIVDAPARLLPDGYEGMTHGEWPPQLHPRMLMDDAAWEAWEAHAVAVCAAAPTVWAALATLARDVEVLRAWQPGGEPLTAAVTALTGLGPAAGPRPSQAWLDERVALAWRQVPAGMPAALTGARERPPTAALAPAMDAVDRLGRPARAFLAAHAFGHWTAYLGGGLRTYVRTLETAAAVLVSEAARVIATRTPWSGDAFVTAVRRTDYLLRHLLALDRFAAEAGDLVESPRGSRA